MRWVFDPMMEHPDEDFLYGYSVTADDMREYEISVVRHTLIVELGGNKAAIEQYLKWKESRGEAFLLNEGHRRERAAAQSLIRREEARKADVRAEEEIQVRRGNRLDALRAEMSRWQTRDAQAIRNFVTERKIPYLVHFTRIENLQSIIENGIVPRAFLPPGFLHNDEMRLDGFPESSSLSVSFPNWQMFYRCRCSDTNRGANWAVLMLSTEALVNQPCLFYPTNAANRRFHDEGDGALGRRMGLAGLRLMFPDDPLGLRESRRLPERATTDPQAEILVFDVIEPERIGAVSLMKPDANAEMLVRRLLPDARLSVGGKLFERRADYKFWQATAKESATDMSGEPDEFPF